MSKEAREMLLPALAMGMSEGTVVEWMVEEGAKVSRDQMVVSIETEKVVTELPAPSAGFIHRVVQAGEKRPVESVIAIIATSETAYQALATEATTAPKPAKAPSGTRSTLTVEETPHVIGGASSDSATGRYTQVSGPARPARAISSGLAKAFSRRHGIDLRTVIGTGFGGRITKRDVEAVLATPLQKAASAAMSPLRPAPVDKPGPRAAGSKATIPYTGTRRAIGERLVQSGNHAAPTFVLFEVDVTELLRARAQLNAKLRDAGTKISLTAFYAKAVSLACKAVPIANATLEENLITVWDEVNIGIAVALPGSSDFTSSLLVPVVHGADAMGLSALHEGIRNQVQKARDGKLEASDLSKGTITISSTDGLLGPGIWSISAPLLNLPNVVNFQPGTPVKRPVIIDDEIVIRTVLPCGLTFDHRCLDGEPAGRFVREICGFLSEPQTMLL